MNRWKIFVVPHTHWDKEWYFTKQDSDILLTMNLKRIIDILNRKDSYKSFTYDGQISVIDDHLKYYPEDHQKLVSLLKDKRLIAGPWYSQPDFFNVTSESLVRNLLVGINVAKEYQADYLKTAYVPDSFGHNNQMPQIYRQFGLKNFIYWRGIRNSELEQHSTLHDWKGLDGSSVRAFNFLLGYWTTGSHFPYQNLTETNVSEQAKKFIENFSPVLTALKTKNSAANKTLLLPLGGDQAPIVELLPEFLDELNKISDDEWIFSNYDEYFDYLDENTNLNLSTLSGELKSPAMSRIHKTIGSQRYDIKKQLKDLEYRLYNNLEPLAVMYQQMGGEYPSKIIRKILKLILTSQAHDSAGGCNSDLTNQNIASRLSNANDLVESKITKMIKEIAVSFETNENEVLFFNPLNLKNDTPKKVSLFTKLPNFDLVHNGKKIKYFINKKEYYNDGMSVSAGANSEIVKKIDGFYLYDLQILNLELEPFEIAKIEIKENKTPVNDAKLDQLENEFYQISLNPNGSISIFDKVNQKRFNDQLEIYAQHDFGDSYDYSPVNEKNKVISQLIKTSSEIKAMENFQQLKITNVYKIPREVKDNKKVNQTFEIIFNMFEDKPFEIKIKTINLAKQIRWRIRIKSDLKNQVSFASQAYQEIARPVELSNDLKVWKKENWKEKPVAIETNESFVYLKDSIGKIGFITKGTNEYEVLNQDELHLTLFRSVDVLGRNNLLWRPGRASGTAEFNIKAIDAELLNKKLTFNLSLVLAKPDTNFWTLSEKINTNIVYYQNQSFNNLNRKFDRFLFFPTKLTQISFANIFEKVNNNFVTKALKLSEDESRIIIRGFNASKEKINIEFNRELKINKCNLLEEEIKTNLQSDELNPYEIVTYSVERIKQ